MSLDHDSRLFVIARWDDQNISLHHIPDTQTERETPEQDEGVEEMIWAKDFAQDLSFGMVKKVLV